MADETILQFGAGRFLRGFVDRFVQHANDSGQNVGGIVVVQSTPGARAEKLAQQPDGYHVLTRGYERDQLVDRVEKVRTIRRALVAASEWPQVLALAESPSLRYVVSNSTESGFTLDPADTLASAPPASMPAKLTQLLWRRYQARGEPLVLLPCELIERNADKLQELVVQLAKTWKLPGDFTAWVTERCTWFNSLVDCIIINPPADHPLMAQDAMMVQVEPYALWAIEKPKGKQAELFHDPAIHLVDELAPFFLRKVRLLNGIHTAMTAKFLPAGFATVQQVIADPQAGRWVRDVLFEEMVPVLAYRLDGVAEFADQTWDRFRNPHLSHKLTDIALNHADKVRVRLVPTVEEYTKLFGKPPRRLSTILDVKPL